MSGCVQVQKCGPFPRRRTLGVCAHLFACSPLLGFFFLFSPRCSVPWGKKRSSSTDCRLPSPENKL